MQFINQLINSDRPKNEVVNTISEFMRKSDPNCLTDNDQILLIKYLSGLFLEAD